MAQALRPWLECPVDNSNVVNQPVECVPDILQMVVVRSDELLDIREPAEQFARVGIGVRNSVHAPAHHAVRTVPAKRRHRAK